MTTKHLTRRNFLSACSRGGMAIGLSSIGFARLLANKHVSVLDYLASYDYKDELHKNASTARYWVSANSSGVNCLSCHEPNTITPAHIHKHKEKIVQCMLCAQNCVVKENEHGKCRARMNINGEYKSLVYGRPISIHVDPIEKKPFYHFLPGSEAYSLATAGCPLSCQFCQNWQLSQASPEDYPVSYTPPSKIVEGSKAQNVPVIAFTYNEATVFTEYFLDIAHLAKQNNIRSILISCGFMNSAPLKDMCEVLDAIKIDLKGYSKDFYRNICKAELQPVLNSIKQIAKSGVHLEIVNLVVPTLNDSEAMLTGLADWITGEIGFDVPIHFTRFHPDYKLQNLPPTPVATLERAREIAMKKGIHYAFVGNVPGHAGNNTFCPVCKKEIISRSSFFVTSNHVKNGRCEYCGCTIAGTWK